MIYTQLRVSDAKDLKSEANAFLEHATDVKKITDEMLELVESTSSVWRGDAQQKYNSQFQGLSDDMNVIFDMCKEYSTDLDEIAKNYMIAEEDNVATGESLKADVDLIK